MNRQFVFLLAVLCFAVNLSAQELHIGTATTDITPALPVALMGQFNLRIAHTAETPLTANVVALESRDGDIVKRFEKQGIDPNPKLDVEVHVLRIEDIAICTNEFELFTDYGIRIQARSNALQTFVVQLVGDGSYLPTAKAVKGGGYSAVIQSDMVGPESGQILVDRTVKLINDMFIINK